MPQVTTSQNIIQDIKGLKVKYDSQIEKVINTKEIRKTTAKSAECNFNGILKKEIKGNYQSYYLCRCDIEYLGDNCQIPKELYNMVQSKILDMLEKIKKEFAHLNRHNREKFLTAMVMLNKFKISKPVLESMINVLRKYVSNDKHLDNRKKLYLFYDAVLLNLFDALEDLKKMPFESFNSSFDLQNERNELNELINKVIQMLEASLEDHTYLNSFLEKNSSHYQSLDTYSFVMTEYKLADYDKSVGMAIQNPNIDTSFNVIESNKLFIDFDANNKIKDSTNNIQILTIAAPLLEEKFKRTSDVALSNALYLKYIDPKSPHTKLLNKDIKVTVIKIDFALIFIPAFEDILNHVNCVAYNSVPGKSNVKGTAIRMDEEKMLVTCEFQANFEFENFYFAISMTK